MKAIVAIVMIVIIQLRRFLSGLNSSFPSSSSTHLTNLHHIRIITLSFKILKQH
jgi:hypothetical protein